MSNPQKYGEQLQKSPQPPLAMTQPPYQIRITT